MLWCFFLTFLLLPFLFLFLFQHSVVSLDIPLIESGRSVYNIRMEERRIFFTCPLINLYTWQPLVVSLLLLSFDLFHSVLNPLYKSILVFLQTCTRPASSCPPLSIFLLSRLTFRFLVSNVFLERVWQSPETRFMYSIPCPPRGKHVMQISYESCVQRCHCKSILITNLPIST